MIISKPLKHENIDEFAAYYISRWNKTNNNLAKPQFNQVKDELKLLLNHNKYISYFNCDNEIGFVFITDDVKFGNLNLNKFKITIGCDLSRSQLIYAIAALDPVYSKINKYSYHPHVEGNDLCLGDNVDSLYTALMEARFEDAVILINNLIHTFNPGSSYADPKYWNGYTCKNCKENGVNGPFSARCCGEEGCKACTVMCGSCHYNAHHSCVQKTKCCRINICEKCTKERSHLFKDNNCLLCRVVCYRCGDDLAMKHPYDGKEYDASTKCENCFRKFYFSSYERYINGNS